MDRASVGACNEPSETRCFTRLNDIVTRYMRRIIVWFCDALSGSFRKQKTPLPFS